MLSEMMEDALRKGTAGGGEGRMEMSGKQKRGLVTLQKP